MSGNLFYPRSKFKLNKPIRKYQKHSPKTAKQMERHLKGVANHRRIEILFLVADEEGISVEGISTNLRCNFKTISEHIRRLTQAGLVEKKYKKKKKRLGKGRNELGGYPGEWTRFISGILG